MIFRFGRSEHFKAFFVNWKSHEAASITELDVSHLYELATLWQCSDAEFFEGALNDVQSAGVRIAITLRLNQPLTKSPRFFQRRNLAGTRQRHRDQTIG